MSFLCLFTEDEIYNEELSEEKTVRGWRESYEELVVLRSAGGAVRTYPAARARPAGVADQGAALTPQPGRACSVTEASAPIDRRPERVLGRERESEEGCSVKREPELASELLPAPDVAWPRAVSGTSDATCVVKQESIVEGPSDEFPGIESEVSDLANSCELEQAPGCVKDEEEENEVFEECLCGVSEAAARAGLYAGHAVKRELVLGPELLQPPDVAFASKEVSVETNTDSPALTVPGANVKCPGERPRSRGAQIELKACFVSLERIAIDRPHILALDNESSSMGEAGRAIHERSLQSGLVENDQEHEMEEREEEGACGVSETNAPHVPTGVRVDTNTASPALTASGARGSCPGEGPRKRGVHIELKTCVVRLDCLAVDTSAASGGSGEGPRCNESRPEQRALRTCSVRLERISVEKHLYTRKEHPQSVTGMFPSNAASRQHKQAHTADEPPKCPVCNKLFSRRDHLKQHLRIHTGEKPYECDICNKKFNSSSYLIIHKRIHTGEKPYTCDICNEHFISTSYLIVHKRNHTGEKLYECDICNEQFDESSSLNKHKRIHTKEKLYTCDICNKQFNLSKYLIIHYMRIHPGKKPYKCDMCNKRCSRSKDLRSHKLIHTGEKPYPCNICYKQFSSVRSLIEHKRIHTGEKPYMCDQCGKQFIYMTSLIAHIRTHTGEKPFACDICYKRFPQPSSLAYHKHIHRGEKLYACGICNKQFYEQRQLNKHNRGKGHIKRKTSTHAGYSLVNGSQSHHTTE